mgnify:CR=1 FL=1
MYYALMTAGPYRLLVTRPDTNAYGNAALNMATSFHLSRHLDVPLYVAPVNPGRHEALHGRPVDLRKRAEVLPVVAQALGGDVVGVLPVVGQIRRGLRRSEARPHHQPGRQQHESLHWNPRLRNLTIAIGDVGQFSHCEMDGWHTSKGMRRRAALLATLVAMAATLLTHAPVAGQEAGAGSAFVAFRFDSNHVIATLRVFDTSARQVVDGLSSEPVARFGYRYFDPPPAWLEQGAVDMRVGDRWLIHVAPGQVVLAEAERIVGGNAGCQDAIAVLLRVSPEQSAAFAVLPAKYFLAERPTTFLPSKEQSGSAVGVARSPSSAEFNGALRSTLEALLARGILALLLLTSKGAAGVTGSGFVTLAATLSAFPTIPVAGLVLLVGVDRFMSEARAITNLIGNGLATVVIARWDGALDTALMARVLNGNAVEMRQPPDGSNVEDFART